jgi:hypothetical protein
LEASLDLYHKKSLAKFIGTRTGILMQGVYAEKPAFQVQKTLQVFSRFSFPLAPIWAISNFTKIRGEICNVVFIAGVVDTGD